jgi:hypothetical protein
MMNCRPIVKGCGSQTSGSRRLLPRTISDFWEIWTIEYSNQDSPLGKGFSIEGKPLIRQMNEKQKNRKPNKENQIKLDRKTRIGYTIS